MPRIHVTGDVVRFTHLLHEPPDASGWGDGVPAAVLGSTLGGAAWLRDLVAVACADLDATILPHDPPADRPPPELLAIWRHLPGATGGPERVWRVEQLLRAQRAGAPSGPDPAPVPEPPAEPADLLVIDDAVLGFRDDPARSRHLLATAPKEIVLKTRAPLPPGALWRELADRRDGLTVVVPVSALRARHAPITRGLSWDRTMEDVYRELTSGASAGDLGLARRVVIPFGSAGVAVFVRHGDGPLDLERVVYHPHRLEEEPAPALGRMPGGTSILTAALVRHLARPDDYPLFVAMARALAAMTDRFALGAGPVSEGPPAEVTTPLAEDSGGQARLRASLHPQAADDDAPESAFRAAFHLRQGLHDADPNGFTCSLLRETTGPGAGHVLAAALQVVTLGLSRTLESAPRARYADFQTVDREEIERTNEIHRLFRAYRANDDPVPLSIAVFGPPGSGKSFAIRQLARHIFGEERETLEWNLSQMASRDDLLSAFDQIRDASVRGRIPLVFWDEFDTGDLMWLGEFLAPMQDAQYCAGSIAHPFGKTIFVFAGGTASTFAEFDRSRRGDAAFRARKGPDFVSRLRGYVNIAGPNPAPANPQAWERGEHLIRRAYLLRSVLARHAPHLIDPVTGVAAVSASVMRGFLCVERFHHGARSIEQLVKMSDLAGSRHFGVAQLPSPAMLALHVSDDFLHRVAEGEAEEAAVERLARSPAWAMLHAPAPSDLVEGRYRARMLIEELREVGWHVARGVAAPERQGLAALPADACEALLRRVHEHWLREHLLLGYEAAAEERHELRLHPAAQAWEAVPETHRARVEAMVADVLGELAGSPFGLAPVA